MNRTAVIILAKQPLLDWLHAVDPTSRQLKLDDLNVDASIYLLPDSDSDEQAEKNLRKICKQIFAHELEGWWSESSAWPQDLSYGVFVKWFLYEFGCHEGNYGLANTLRGARVTEAEAAK